MTTTPTTSLSLILPSASLKTRILQSIQDILELCVHEDAGETCWLCSELITVHHSHKILGRSANISIAIHHGPRIPSQSPKTAELSRTNRPSDGDRSNNNIYSHQQSFGVLWNIGVAHRYKLVERSLISGAHISALQMSMYIWSILGTIVCLWALKQIRDVLSL
jgi:hypothetical protein